MGCEREGTLGITLGCVISWKQERATMKRQDPSLAQLQDELAKCDPSDETLAAILSVLEP
jgi:hypothetical protein